MNNIMESKVWQHKLDFYKVILAMESRGIGVDVEFCQFMEQKGKDEMERVVKELGLNPGNKADLTKLLIDELELPIVKVSEKTGKPSFDKFAMEEYDEILENRDNPTAKRVLEYRGWQKAVSSYYKPYQELLSTDGRLRADYKLHGTVTGRLSCVTGDTFIEMPRDLVADPKGIPISKVKEGDYVYAFDWQRKLTLREVLWVGITDVREVVKVTMRNSEGHTKSIRLTADHLMRMYNGDWRPAGSIMHRAGQPRRDAGPRLMHFPKRILDEGYIKFFPNSVARGNGQAAGGRNSEHRWIYEQYWGKKLSTKFDVHHSNFSRLDNDIDNLEYLSKSDHMKLHHNSQDSLDVPSEVHLGAVDYRVISVEPDGVEEVWDMTVDVDHNFIANGVCVHNCSKPNLQQIPKEGTKPWNGRTKECFEPAPGYKLVEVDYSQLELRLGTAYSREESLMVVFAEGRDIFTEMSKELGMSRQETKGLVYSIQYGAGVNRISNIFDVSRQEAQTIINNFYKTYPGFRKMTRACESLVKKNSYLRLLSGRRRHFRNDSEARKSFNSLIQGGAADLVERAMVRIFKQIDSDDCKMLLQVHDSIIFEMKEDRVMEFVPAIIKLMVNHEIEELETVKFDADAHWLGGDTIVIP